MNLKVGEDHPSRGEDIVDAKVVVVHPYRSRDLVAPRVAVVHPNRGKELHNAKVRAEHPDFSGIASCQEAVLVEGFEPPTSSESCWRSTN